MNREQTIKKIAQSLDAKINYHNTEFCEYLIKDLLNEFPELAIVNRGAVLTDESYTDGSHEHNILKLNYEFAMKKGWVKEVKD
jgi:hypothetical protein